MVKLRTFLIPFWGGGKYRTTRRSPGIGQPRAPLFATVAALALLLAFPAFGAKYPAADVLFANSDLLEDVRDAHQEFTFGNLPTCNASTDNHIYIVSNAPGAGTCDGGGSTHAECMCSNGVIPIYIPLSGGGVHPVDLASDVTGELPGNSVEQTDDDHRGTIEIATVGQVTAGTAVYLALTPYNVAWAEAGEGGGDVSGPLSNMVVASTHSGSEHIPSDSPTFTGVTTVDELDVTGGVCDVGSGSNSGILGLYDSSNGKTVYLSAFPGLTSDMFFELPPDYGSSGDYLASGGNGSTDWLSLSGYAPLVSPVLTGDPTGPTAAADDDDTSLATTAFVQGEITDGIAAANHLGSELTSTDEDFVTTATQGEIRFESGIGNLENIVLLLNGVANEISWSSTSGATTWNYTGITLQSNKPAKFPNTGNKYAGTWSPELESFSRARTAMRKDGDGGFVWLPDNAAINQAYGCMFKTEFDGYFTIDFDDATEYFNTPMGDTAPGKWIRNVSAKAGDHICLLTWGSNGIYVITEYTGTWQDQDGNQITPFVTAILPWTARNMNTDGTNCVAPAQVTIPAAAGIVTDAVICDDGGTIYGSGRLDNDAHPAQDATFRLHASRPGGGTALAGDFSYQCKGDDDPIDNTWATGGAADLTLTTVDDFYEVELGSLDIDTECDAGDGFWWRYVIDDANHDATTANILAAEFEYVIFN